MKVIILLRNSKSWDLNSFKILKKKKNIMMKKEINTNIKNRTMVNIKINTFKKVKRKRKTIN